ncbi:heme-binding domain-containing protein [Flavobacterium solisilvae]|uniref:Heme-binding domain-containing protein n=1 Tax=Flavobacterium solisilvae TaxID=1852019 RepID=A0ABX1QUN9_9FLAO|nr:heme-binding domain-containing protein [Flavobacterium solisilvae]NMH24899.1 heme-binding domain-containing protein [Flavobacterium solisilvae]
MKKILIALLVVLVVLQFFQIDKTNPAVDESKDFLKTQNTPEEIASIIKTSCYDCHSNESKYPWYSNVQPAGWFLKDHIDEGRRELNFSTFTDYEVKRQDHKLEECIEYIEKDEMPLGSYTLVHREAALTEAQKNILIDYFKSVRTKLNYKE